MGNEGSGLRKESDLGKREKLHHKRGITLCMKNILNELLSCFQIDVEMITLGKKEAADRDQVPGTSHFNKEFIHITYSVTENKRFN